LSFLEVAPASLEVEGDELVAGWSPAALLVIRDALHLMGPLRTHVLSIVPS
jgi:hypothetical protein